MCYEKRREEKIREERRREGNYLYHQYYLHHQYLTYGRSSQCLPAHKLSWSQTIQEVTELTAGTQIHCREDQTNTENTETSF